MNFHSLTFARSRELLKTEGEARGFNLPEGPCTCFAWRLVTSIVKSRALTARAHENSLINTFITWQLIACSTGFYAIISFSNAASFISTSI